MLEEIERVWDNRSEEYYEKLEDIKTFIHDRQTPNHPLIKRILNLNPESVLEPACGSGKFSFFFSKEGIPVTATDISKGTIEFCDYASNVLGLPISTKVDNIESMDFDGGSFDLVFNESSIEHTINPQKALNEMSRVSSRYVVVSVPNRLRYDANWLKIKVLKRSYERDVRFKPPFPWKFFKMFEKANLSVVDYFGYGILPSFVDIAMHQIKPLVIKRGEAGMERERAPSTENSDISRLKRIYYWLNAEHCYWISNSIAIVGKK